MTFLKESIVNLHIFPFKISLSTTIPEVRLAVERLYSDYDFLPSHGAEFCDFHIRIQKPPGIRSCYKPQAEFLLDGKKPFKPLPLSQAYPFFEWGLNWCIASSCYTHLLIHAAVVERHGKSLILCGVPGAGKSTLCAALVSRGWRLLSDEMAMFELPSLKLLPIVRPVSLKNDSIHIIQDFANDVVMGKSYHDTAKGTVSHMKPPTSSVLAATVPSSPQWIVFPQYQAKAPTSLVACSKASMIPRLKKNSFNARVLGDVAHNALSDLVQRCLCFDFIYSNLNEAVQLFGELSEIDDY